jgi:mannose-6-phosphate isomerase-like protein (cupin superfamily)
MAKYEVVFVTGGSVHVRVEADNEEQAIDLATPLAIEGVGEAFAILDGEGRVTNTDKNVDVYLGDVDDVLFVDKLTVDA